MGYLAVYYVLAALVFFLQLSPQTNPLRRQQLKWLTRGTLLTAIPFTVLDVIPFLAGVPVPGFWSSWAAFAWFFCPLPLAGPLFATA